MSTSAKLSLAHIAMALRDEQLNARVVHYKEELETNAELDAVTAQVIAELQMLQRAAGPKSTAPATSADDRSQLEIELISNLKGMLGKLFPSDRVASIVQRKLGEVSKRFARLFFESELHDKIRGTANELKTMRFSEQALYHVFARNEEYLMRQLEGFEFSSPEVKSEARDGLANWIKELRNDFLGKTTPELNALVRILNEVLMAFFTQELPPVAGELAWEIVKEAKLAEGATRSSYKVSATAFPRFRQAFEHRFLQRLVPFAADGMLKRVHASEGKFRVETLRFVADPHIFSDVCELICEGSYDFLYNEGFLDLPGDWRARLGATGAV
ncbi:hypothetical protein BH09MYX1_BH09MYX1_27170 [soil metagenome]